MVRPLVPKIHIFFPEASNRGKKIDLCEHFFITHSFSRKIKAKIESYAEAFEADFKKAIKEKNKKNSPYAHDLFFVVLDTDINANRANINIVRQQIQTLVTKYAGDADIILSGRSFEVWLCMYGRTQYTKPYIDQDILNSDVYSSYEKKEKWYLENADRLYKEYPNAKKASILSKSNVFNITELPPPTGFNLIQDLPDLSNSAVLNYLVQTTPFTYFEHLIECLNQYK